MTSKARNIADLGSNDVIETTATGVDVTGTVTADGLKSDGDIEISTSNVFGQGLGYAGNTSSAGAGTMALYDATTGGVIIDGFAPSYLADSGVVLKQSGVKGFHLKNNNDVHLYEDTGTTAKFVWDSSAEELEIGSSTDKLELGASFQRFRKGNENKILIGNTSSALGSGTGLINYLYDPEPFIWYQGAERMRIDSAGNVGIGTASPSGFSQYKGLTISDSAGGFVEMKSTTGSITTFISADNGAGGGVVGTRTNDPLQLRTNDIERARIDSSGKLLVGTTSGTGRFNIAQSGNVWAQTINHSNATQFFIDFQQNGSQVGSITGNGTNASYNTTSDERLKENIKDTTHVVNIDDIRVREYDWKVDGSHQRFGFIAQELEAVYPEAVTSPEDENEMKSVDYSKLVPLLVKEIQTLKARIETLENN